MPFLVNVLNKRSSLVQEKEYHIEVSEWISPLPFHLLVQVTKV